MEPGAILIGGAILVVAVLYVINPVVYERKKQPEKADALKKDRKGRQKEALAAIRDLDFDFQTGKVTQEDYETLRAQLVLQAAEYIQTKKQENEKIEEMIRSRLQRVKSSVKCEKCGGDIGPQDLFCPTCRVAVKNQAGSKKPAVQITCPGCGKRVREGDLYCTSCGERVNGQATIKNTTAEN